MRDVDDDAIIIERLRAGDESAFTSLVESYSPTMLRVAMTFVPTRAVAEEVVQEAWLGVLRGLEGFEGRSSLKTWIFRILANIAKTRGAREGRTVPFSSLEPDEPAVDPGRFTPADHPEWPNHWMVEPVMPEREALSSEALKVVADAIDALPPSQRAVVTLRDVHGWTSEEACNALGIEQTNQRVLLHRARSKLRRALEPYLDQGDDE